MTGFVSTRVFDVKAREAAPPLISHNLKADTQTQGKLQADILFAAISRVLTRFYPVEAYPILHLTEM